MTERYLIGCSAQRTLCVFLATVVVDYFPLQFSMLLYTVPIIVALVIFIEINFRVGWLHGLGWKDLSLASIVQLCEQNCSPRFKVKLCMYDYRTCRTCSLDNNYSFVTILENYSIYRITRMFCEHQTFAKFDQFATINLQNLNYY